MLLVDDMFDWCSKAVKRKDQTWQLTTFLPGMFYQIYIYS